MFSCGSEDSSCVQPHSELVSTSRKPAFGGHPCSGVFDDRYSENSGSDHGESYDRVGSCPSMDTMTTSSVTTEFHS